MNEATIPAMVQARIAAHGEAVILRKKDRGIWQSISWNALGARIRAIGSALKASGLADGEVAGILGETSADWIAIDLAIQGAGAIALGLTPTDGLDATADTLAAAGCRLLFVENEEQLDKVLHIRDRCPALSRIVIMDMKGLREFSDPGCASLTEFAAAPGDASTWEAGIAALRPDAIAVLAPTMGTSGVPALVALTHANLMAQASGIATLTGQTAADERLAFLPLSLIAERVFGLYAALHAGTISNVVESAETVPENLAELRPTIMFAIPRIWEKLHAAIAIGTSGATWLQRILYRWAERQRGVLAPLADALVLRPVRRAIGLDRLRLAFTGAAPISSELVGWYRAHGIALSEVYGVAECGGIAAISPPADLRPGAVGTAVPWGELAIAADGQVLIRGPHVCAGMWRDGTVTSATDAEGWLPTGDLGRIEAGQLVLTGRSGEALTVGGREFMPASFENVVKLSPYIADAVLVAGPGGLACLVMLEFDAVEKWAHERNLNATSAVALARAEPVLALIAAELAARAPGFALIGFRILAGRIAPEDPELTATMRLRRAFVLRKYHHLIEEMYRAA